MSDESIWDTEKMLKEGAVILTAEQKYNLPREEKRISLHRPAPLSDPFEDGGWSCSGCKKPIPHEDVLGVWDASNTSFTVVGYYCSKCETRYLFPEHAEKEIKQMPKYRTMSGWERMFWRQQVPGH
jgi:hypothetical protein